MFCCYKKSNKTKEKMIEELKEYSNGWFYMIKRNENRDDEYWWWNKRTDHVSYKKPENFDIELVTHQNNEDLDENDNFKQEIIKTYGEWNFMKTTYSENETKEWWWNPTTKECQFDIPKSIKGNIV